MDVLDIILAKLKLDFPNYKIELGDDCNLVFGNKVIDLPLGLNYNTYPKYRFIKNLLNNYFIEKSTENYGLNIVWYLDMYEQIVNEIRRDDELYWSDE